MSGIDAGLAHPSNLQRYQRPEELLCLIHVRSDVVIHKEKEFLLVLYRANLVENIVDRPPGLGCAKDRLNRAELAFEMAAAARFHQTDRQITLPAKNRAVGLYSRKRRPFVRPVEF